MGEEEAGICGRCWSKLERFDCRRRGGGGGGGITTLPVLSFETTREVLRFEDIDDVRLTLTTGDEGSKSESMVLLRDGGPCVELAVRVEVDR